MTSWFEKVKARKGQTHLLDLMDDIDALIHAVEILSEAAKTCDPDIVLAALEMLNQEEPPR